MRRITRALQSDYRDRDDREQILLSVIVQCRSLRIRALAEPLEGETPFPIAGAAAQNRMVPMLVDPASIRHLLAALRVRGWNLADIGHAPTLLPSAAIVLAHDDWQLNLALHPVLPGFYLDPEEGFDYLWEHRRQFTLRATAIPVIDRSALGGVTLTKSLQPQIVPTVCYTCSRLAVDVVTDPLRWALAYLECPEGRRPELWRLAAARYRRRGRVLSDFAAILGVVPTLLGTRRRWERSFLAAA